MSLCLRIIHHNFLVVCFSLNLENIFLVTITWLWLLESELFDLKCHCIGI